MLHPALSSLLTPFELAGMQLAERRMAVAQGLPCASVDEILAPMTTRREEVHEYADEILAHMAGQEPVSSLSGGESAAAHRARLAALAVEAFDFTTGHAGCRVQRGGRPRYSAYYRQFVIELRQRHADVTAAEVATAIRLPLSTLEAWMQRARAAGEASVAPDPGEPRAATAEATTP